VIGGNSQREIIRLAVGNRMHSNEKKPSMNFNAFSDHLKDEKIIYLKRGNFPQVT